MKVRTVAVVLAAAGLLAGCAGVVDGRGTTRLGAGPGGAPSSSSAPPAQATPCPHVHYPAARLSFTCITTGLTPSYAGQVWPLSEAKTVEPATGWVLEEGAGHWGSAAGHSLGDIAANVRQQMVDHLGYGESPRLSTVADREISVAGAKGHLLQTTVTINPAWAKANRTKVRQEKLWIVAVDVGTDDVSLWYTSVPDLAKSLWPKVPSVIDSIRVG